MKEQIEKFLELQERNYQFILERLRLQSTAGYNPNILLPTCLIQVNKRKHEVGYISIRERQYTNVDLLIIKGKIKILKNKLKNIL